MNSRSEVPGATRIVDLGTRACKDLREKERERDKSARQLSSTLVAMDSMRLHLKFLTLIRAN